jgi:hypothetical protein
MMLFEAYPPTEGVSAGVTVGESFKALFAPIMLIMMPMMLLTASMELPPSSWVPSVLQSGGVNGLLVFGFVFGIMGTLRLLAAPVVRVLTPTGILLAGSILATLGLYLFSYAETTAMAFATAAIWAVGIAYFWPTMLGFVAEYVPRSGALGLAIMGGIGAASTAISQPLVGQMYDSQLEANNGSGIAIQALRGAVPGTPEHSQWLAVQAAAGSGAMRTIAFLPAILIVLFALLYFTQRGKVAEKL